MSTVLHKLYRRAWPTRWGPIPLLMATMLSFLCATGFAQTTIVGPLNGGNFELGGTFALNNWTVVNTTPVNPTNQWNLSTLATGTSFTGNRAFISNDAGVTYAYTNTGDSRVHFYRDVTFPAGETIINLTFVLRVEGEGSYDGLNVSLMPTTTTLLSSNSTGGGTHAGLLPYYSGMTTIGTSPQYNTFGGATGATVTIVVPASFAGTTQRLVFTWRNDTSFGTNPPAAVDDILLTSAVPANYNATAQGGLWSSPATWVGGVVPPAGNDITIPNGSHVMIDQVLNYRHITVNGTLSYATTNVTTTTGNYLVGATGRVLFSTAAAALQTVNIGGNFTNNGFVNASAATLQWPNTLVGNYTLDGTGTWASFAGRGVIRTLSVQNNGTFTINTTANLTVSSGLLGTCNNFISNGKLRVDNSSTIIDNDVQFAVCTNMGAGYVTAPVVGGTASANWAAGAITTGNIRMYLGEQYVALNGGTAALGSEPVHTGGTYAAGADGIGWLHVGPAGTIGLGFASQSATLTPTAGSQYFWNGALYTAINGVAMTSANIQAALPFTTTVGGLVTIGTTQFRCVGTPATVSVTHDATTQTVRRINVTSSGAGYAGTPTGVVLTTGVAPGTTALFTASMWNVLGATGSVCNKASATTTTGAVDIKSSTGPVGAGVGSIAALRGGYYGVAPTVGFSAPSRVNLVQTQGSGYLAAPTVSVAGGTQISGAAMVAGDFQVNVAEGRVISVYYTGATSKIYSVPPTLSLTASPGVTATISWGPGDNAWPAATANLNAGGQVDSYTMTNEGYGYASTVTPTCALSGPLAGELAATAPTARIMVYSATQAFYIPQTTNPYNTLGSFMPANNRLAALTSQSGLSLGANTEVYADAPLTLTSLIDLGGFTLRASSIQYAGVAATVNGICFNGSFELSMLGGQATATRTFPLGGGTGAGRYGVYVAGAGASVATGGYTFTGIRATSTAAPSGSVNPAGNMTGTRGMRLQMQGSGTLSNSNTGKTFQLFWNALDNLVSNNASIFVAEAGALTGPWNIRSIAGVAGSLPATGSRTTATVAPGPISNSADYFFGFANNGFTAPPALAYNVSRLTAQTYNGIGPAPYGDGSGTTTTFGSGDDGISPVIDLATGGTAFTYQGQSVTGFRISTNGNIQLQTAGGATGSTAFTNGYTDANLLNVLAPFWDDLISTPNSVAGAQNNIRYKITGTTPNRIVLVDWTNMTAFGAAGSQLFFQVEMNEATGAIRYNYGDMQMFNGTANHRWTYSLGLKGRYASAQPSAGQIFANLYENTDKFSHEQGQLANYGANGLVISPAPRSSYVFTPGVYPGYTIPGATPPSNDNIAGVIDRPSLSTFPSNIAWDNGTNTTNLYSTRYATHSPQAVCGGPSDNKDVWFRFNANEVNVTARVYSSVGYIARVEILTSGLTSLVCAVGTAGGQTDAVATGLTIGQDYYVRVSHDLTGTAGIFTGNAVVNGTVVGVAINSGGTNYTVGTTGTTTGARMVATGGGANTFIGSVTAITGGSVTGGGFDGGYGYATVPTIAVESPDWGITGEFGIVIYAPPINDNCSGAIALTSINTNNCVTGQNQLLNVKTSSATPSLEGNGPCNSGSDDDLWYSFVATGVSTNITITGNGTYDPAIQFWTGTGCGAKALVGGGQACLNATGAGGTETVNLNTNIGDTYWIRIYHAGTGTNPGDFDICVTTPVPGCIASPTSPAVAATTCATPTTLLVWPAAPSATLYDVYLDGGPATTLVSGDQAATNYDAGVLAAGNYAWRIVPKNPNGSASGCATWTFTVNSPTPLTTAPGTRCGIGTVTLGSTASPGQVLRWYDAPTGGNLLASGATPLPYVTPVISSTTPYYVSSASALTDNGLIGSNGTTTASSFGSPLANLWEGTRRQYIIQASELSAAGFGPGNINSMSFNVTTLPGGMLPLTNYTIRVGGTNTSAFTGAYILDPTVVRYTNASYVTVAGINTFPLAPAYNWNGLENILVEICNDNDPTGLGTFWSSTATVQATNLAFSACYGENDDDIPMCNIDNGGGTGTTIRPDFILNGQILCSGPRVLVNATVTAPPAITATATPGSICEGSSSNLLVTSGNGGYAYVWQPGALAGSGHSVSPVSTTQYTVTATDGGSGCVNVATATVIVRSTPPVPTVTPLVGSPETFCHGPTRNFTASAVGGPTTILVENFNGAAAGWVKTSAHTTVGGSNTALMDWAYRPVGFSDASSGILAGFTTADGGNYATSISDAGQSGSTTRSTLTSPTFSTVGISNLSLTFEHVHLNFGENFVGVEISSDGGTTWDPTPLVDYTATNQGTMGTPGTPANANIAIPGTYTNLPSVKIRFRYDASWGWYWILDNVQVNGTINITGYKWTASGPGSNLPAAATVSNPANTSITFDPNPGTWTFSAQSVNAFGCESALVPTGTKTVNPRPTVTFNANSFQCIGQTQSMDVNFTGTGPWAFQYTDPAPVNIPVQVANPLNILIPAPVAVGTINYISTFLQDANGCIADPFDLGSVAITVPNPCEVTWNGNTSSDWTDANNWTPNNAAPSVATSVIIPPNRPNYPHILGGSTVNCASMNLNGETIQIDFNGKIRLFGNLTGWAKGVSKVEGLGKLSFEGTGLQEVGGTIQAENVDFLNTSTLPANGVQVKAGAKMRIEPAAASGSGIVTFGNSAKFLNNGKFTLGANATASAKVGPVPTVFPSAASIQGNITVEQYLPNTAVATGSWYFLGSPVAGTGDGYNQWADDFKVMGLVPGFGSQGGNVFGSPEAERSTIFEYNELLHNVRTDTVQKNGWRVASNSDIVPGRGYRVFVNYASNSKHRVDNIGPLVIGDATDGSFDFPALSRHEYAPCYPTTPSVNYYDCNEANRGWNLLANPFACDIDWNSVNWTRPSTSDLNNAFFTWDGSLGGYRAFVGAGGSSYLGVTGPTLGLNPSVIPSHQAFFVKVLTLATNGAIMSVKESAKTTSNPGVFTRTNVVANNQLKIGLSRVQDTDGYKFVTMMMIRDNATDGFDPDYDGYSMGSARPFVHFPMGNENMILSAIGPVAETKTVPLNFGFGGQNGTFRFSYEDANSFDNVVVYLKDNHLNTITEVAQGPYTFVVDNTPGSRASDRFELILNPDGVTTVKPVASNELGLAIYPNPSMAGKGATVAISGFEAENAALTITDVLGRVVFSTNVALKAEGVTTYDLTHKLSAGVYTVKTTGGSKSLTQKLVVN